MYIGFGRILFVLCLPLSIQTNQSLHRYHSRIFRRHFDHSSLNDGDFDASLISRRITTNNVEPLVFFQNEPVPLASSVVDDLTTLASAVYILSLIIIVFVVLAWITHYNAPCSSIIASLLSGITGLPEPIIHSVALCGSCCIWCEKTWLFRRIHQFNIWMSNKIKQFISVTCKLVYDSICPCCRPPDTPTNRSIIGSLPASIIAMVNVPDPPNPSQPKPAVTVKEPTSMQPTSVTVNVDLHTQSTTKSGKESPNTITSSTTSQERKTNSKKRRKSRRKRKQFKQRSVFDESTNLEKETDNLSEDGSEEEQDDDDEDDENTKIY